MVLIVFVFFSDVEEIVKQSQLGDDEYNKENLVDVTEGDIVVRDGLTKQEVDVSTVRRIREFKEPENDINISNFSKKKFTPQSKRKILWAVNMFNDWRNYRRSQPMPPHEIVDANLDLVGSFTK